MPFVLKTPGVYRIQSECGKVYSGQTRRSKESGIKEHYRHTQHPIQWVPGAVSLGIKRPGGEGDHSSPSSTEAKNPWNYNFLPNTSSCRGA